MIYMIIGVSGVGKTTIGRELAEQLGLPFYDADDFHSNSNILKLKNGTALTDADRIPWLQSMAKEFQSWHQSGGAVLACSALKESYRDYLQKAGDAPLKSIFLEASPEVISQRMAARKKHFMHPELLRSQFEILEKPAYGIHVNAEQSIQEVVQEVIQALKGSEIGIMGLGVMGKNLALNIANHGFSLSAYNRQLPPNEVDIAHHFATENTSLPILGFDEIRSFVDSLQSPRRILLMVNAGPVVDLIIDEILPMLDEGDLLIDGGNSHFTDTNRRMEELDKRGILYLGMGVSGGEKGALKGPSIMVGGSPEAYQRISPILQAIAAEDTDRKACVSLIGPSGSGHFIKTIHNGIEYAEMQLIAEIYHLLRLYADYSPRDIASLFASWSSTDLNSYLLEITIDIVQKKEGEEYLIDLILDKAGQKGTGHWSTEMALALGKPSDTITSAVMTRYLSAMKSTRLKASEKYADLPTKLTDLSPKTIENAFRAARIINHAIGFDIIAEASRSYQWSLDLSEVARIWTSGCIIRSELMRNLSHTLKNFEGHLLLHPEIVQSMKGLGPDLKDFVTRSISSDCSIPGFSSGLNYFLGFKSAQSPSNIIQAQRDFFGAHTYERIDKPRGEFYHTDWSG